MTSKVFTAGVVIDSAWLNDVNDAVYNNATTLNTFSGDGSTLSFALTGTVVSATKSWVFIHGVYQQKASYSIVANVLTFTEAPPLGTNNIEISF